MFCPNITEHTDTQQYTSEFIDVSIAQRSSLFPQETDGSHRKKGKARGRKPSKDWLSHKQLEETIYEGKLRCLYSDIYKQGVKDGLTNKQLVILNAICYYNINGKYCHMTNKQFAKLAKCTVVYVSRTINHTLKPYIIIGREEGRARGPRKQKITIRRIYTYENKVKFPKLKHSSGKRLLQEHEIESFCNTRYLKHLYKANEIAKNSHIKPQTYYTINPRQSYDLEQVFKGCNNPVHLKLSNHNVLQFHPNLKILIAPKYSDDQAILRYGLTTNQAKQRMRSNGKGNFIVEEEKKKICPYSIGRFMAHARPEDPTNKKLMDKFFKERNSALRKLFQLLVHKGYVFEADFTSDPNEIDKFIRCYTTPITHTSGLFLEKMQQKEFRLNDLSFNVRRLLFQWEDKLKWFNYIEPKPKEEPRTVIFDSPWSRQNKDASDAIAASLSTSAGSAATSDTQQQPPILARQNIVIGSVEKVANSLVNNINHKPVKNKITVSLDFVSSRLASGAYKKIECTTDQYMKALTDLAVWTEKQRHGYVGAFIQDNKKWWLVKI